MARQRTTIEVFFRAFGERTIVESFRRIERAAAGVDRGFRLVGSGSIGALRSGAGLAAAFARNLGGIVPVANLVKAGIGGIVSLLQKSVAAAAALGAAAYAAGLGFKSIYESTSDLNATILALRALNNETSKTQPLLKADPKGTGLYDAAGTAARKTAGDLSFLNRVAFDNGLVVRNISKDYLKLRASINGTNIEGKTMRNLFEGIAQTSTVLGLSQDNVSRAFTALSQIGSKGQVYAEELKGQLSEAIPGAVQIAARSYGLSVKEFNKLVEAGSVDSETFFKKFSVQLQKDYGEAAKSMANTTRIAVGRLASAWENAKAAIGSGNLDRTIGRLVTQAAKLLDILTSNGAFERFGTKLAGTLSRFIAGFDRLIKDPRKAERFLDILASGFDKAVVSAQVMVGVIREVVRWVGYLYKAFGGPTITFEGFIGQIERTRQSVEKLFQTFATGRFSDNPFSNFIAALFRAVVEAGRALFTLGRGAALEGVQSIGEVFQRAADWLGQLAFALRALSTGQIENGTNSVGLGILENLILAVDQARALKEQLQGVVALVTGGDLPSDAQPGMRKAFGYRAALGNLVTGGENEDVADANGETIYKKEDLETLFKVRDILGKIVDYVDRNKEAIGAFFVGIADALKGVVDVVDSLTTALEAMGINNSAAYFFGVFFALKAIPGSAALASAAFAGMSSAILATKGALTALTVGMSGFAIAGAAVGAGAVLGIFVAIYAMVTLLVNNLPLLTAEFGNMVDILQGGLLSLIAKFIRGIGDILSYIPGVGGMIQDELNQLASNYDTRAESNFAAVRAKQVAAYLDRQKNGTKALEANYSWNMFDGAQSVADASQATNDNIAAAAAGGGAGAPAGFGKPVQIIIDGQVFDLMGKESDSASFEQLAAKAARGRIGVAPGWAGS